MELIVKEVKMDQNTFAPVMRVTIELPLEIMRDGVALMGENEVKMILGTELYNILKDK
jgi:hypothetical protein